MLAGKHLRRPQEIYSDPIQIQKVGIFSTQFNNIQLATFHHIYEKRSQDLKNVYHDAGQFYWGTKQAWLDNEPIFGDKSSPHILPHYRVQDIDTEDDWKRAEQIYLSTNETK